MNKNRSSSMDTVIMLYDVMIMIVMAMPMVKLHCLDDSENDDAIR